MIVSAQRGPRSWLCSSQQLRGKSLAACWVARSTPDHASFEQPPGGGVPWGVCPWQVHPFPWGRFWDPLPAGNIPGGNGNFRALGTFGGGRCTLAQSPQNLTPPPSGVENALPPCLRVIPRWGWGVRPSLKKACSGFYPGNGGTPNPSYTKASPWAPLLGGQKTE